MMENKLEFIDTHIHLYDEAYGTEQDEVITKAQAAGISKMIQPDIDSHERDKMFAISDQHPGVLFTMLGLYPGSVEKNWEEEMAMMYDYLDRDIVAIGEIGLDYHYSADTAELQKRALGAQFELAARLDLPVNIHMRDATEDFLKVVSQYRHLGLRGNLHAFSGSYETFMALQKYGDWSVGIGGVLTFKKSRLPEVVKRIPLEKIFLETDGPYLAPVPVRGTRNDSSNIPIIAAKIAEIKEISIEEVASVTTANAKRIFKI